jgi:hypothetical protein
MSWELQTHKQTNNNVLPEQQCRSNYMYVKLCCTWWRWIVRYHHRLTEVTFELGKYFSSCRCISHRTALLTNCLGLHYVLLCFLWLLKKRKKPKNQANNFEISKIYRLQSGYFYCRTCNFYACNNSVQFTSDMSKELEILWSDGVLWVT